MRSVLLCRDRILAENVDPTLVEVYKMQCQAELDAAKTKHDAALAWNASREAKAEAERAQAVAERAIATARKKKEEAQSMVQAAEDAQHRAKGADFIRVKTEILLHRIVKMSIENSTPLLDLSRSMRSIVMDEDDSEDDEAYSISSSQKSRNAFIAKKSLSPKHSLSRSDRSGRRGLLANGRRHPKLSESVRRSSMRSSRRRLMGKAFDKSSSIRMLKNMSMQNMLSRSSSRRLIEGQLRNPGSSRRCLLSTTSSNRNISDIGPAESKSDPSIQKNTLLSFIPEGAPLSMFPEDMSELDNYTFRDGHLGTGYYRKDDEVCRHASPPPITPPPESPNDCCSPECESPILIVAHESTTDIECDDTSDDEEEKRSSETARNVATLAKMHPEADREMIEDCVRASVGDLRQASRILYLRTKAGRALTIVGEEAFVKSAKESKIVQTLHSFLKAPKRVAFTFDPWKCGAPGLVLSNENLIVTAPGRNAAGTARTVLGSKVLASGRHYWEVVAETCPVGERSCGTIYIGLALADVNLQNPLCGKNCIGWYDESFNDLSGLCAVRPSIPGGTCTGRGRRAGIYFDAGTGEVRFFVNRKEIAKFRMKPGAYFPAVSVYADATYPDNRVTLNPIAALPSGIAL
eukprot:g821.t1